jgi:hypothetical protein
MPDKRLHALDLFSGIGGFAYALRSVTKTVAYCEIDPVCRQVLTKNMKGGKIDCAPIFDDITQLNALSIKKVCHRVDLVCGGFPCQDVAVSGKHQGVHGGRTGLFVHIIRLVQELPSVKYVFLENVANICNLGLKDVLVSLEKLGFSYAYGIFQANEKEVGSYHARRRCFILACRKTHTSVPMCRGGILRAWSKEPRVGDRLIPRKSKTDRHLNMQRFAMLGNSVVPQCVAHAWNVLGAYLLGMLQDSDGQIIDPHSISAGLDYPGIGPEHAYLKDSGRVSYFAVTDKEAVDAFKQLSTLEGIIPALETSHAIAFLGTLCKSIAGKKIVVNCSGRGDKDINTVASWDLEMR